MGAEILGTGTYFPRKKIENGFFENSLPKYSNVLGEYFDGTKERYHAALDETSIYMGKEAAKEALRRAGTNQNDIDLVLCYSVFNDFEYPKDGNFIVKDLGLKNATCWTVDTGCSSSLTMLKLANNLISTGKFSRILIVAIVNWVNRGIDKSKDYSSLGDAAAALVLGKSDRNCMIGESEVLNTDLISTIYMSSPFCTKQKEYVVFGKSEASRDFFFREVPTVAKELMAKCNIFPRELDWIVAHQAGERLLKEWCAALEIPWEKNLNTFAHHANVSAANIPVVLDYFINTNPTIKRGDKILMFSTAVGVQLSAVLWEF